jgi:hypothetical protein
VKSMGIMPCVLKVASGLRIITQLRLDASRDETRDSCA